MSPHDSTAAYAGLQYADTAYVSFILALLVPVSFASLFAVFAGNAKHVRYFFASLHTVAAGTLYTLAWVCNLDTDAIIGLPIGISVSLVLGMISPFYTDGFAFPCVTLYSILVFITTIFQLIAKITPLSLGVLSLVPQFVTAPPPEQFVWQMSTFTILSFSAFVLFEKFLPAVAESENWQNCQSAFVSSYFFVAGCSYLFILTGLSATSSIDPIGLFSIPSSFGSHMSLNLLLVWSILTALGWSVQTKRQKMLRQHYDACHRPLIEEIPEYNFIPDSF